MKHRKRASTSPITAKKPITTDELFFSVMRGRLDRPLFFGGTKTTMKLVTPINVSEHHLHRYLAEFDFRYSNRELSDGQRTALAIKQAEGKRLWYAEPRQESENE